MPRERIVDKKRRAAEIAQRLGRAYPDSRCSLDFGTPFQLLVAVILSAQCTDQRVNIVTKQLFHRWPDAPSLAAASQSDVERVVYSTGFFRQKAGNLRAMAALVVERHNGAVPESMEQLIALPGVARKTANVVLHVAFGKADGIAVDTHVHRIARLLRLTAKDDPTKIEQDLMRVVEPEQWGRFTHLVIDHGRAVCVAHRPQCQRCVVGDLCPSARLVQPKAASASSTSVA